MDDGLDFDFPVPNGIGDNCEFYASLTVLEMNYIVHEVILTVLHTIVKNKNVLD